MAITYGAELGNGESAGSTTVAITTSAAHTAGQRIVLHVGYTGNTRTLSSLTDSAGNTYTRTLRKAITGAVIEGFVSDGALALNSGGTITAVYSGTSLAMVMLANTDNGALATFDATIDSSATLSTAVSDTLATVANKTIVYSGTAAGLSGLTGDSTYNGAPFTLIRELVHSVQALRIIVEYAILSTQSTQNYSATLQVASNWANTMHSRAELASGTLTLPVLGG